MRPIRASIPQFELNEDDCAPILTGNSVAAHSMRQLVGLVADARDPIVLTGPAGSGKSALARAIHTLSPLAPCPFNAVTAERFDPETLSAMWEGTLFIRDIDALPVVVQHLLLRWLHGRQSDHVRLIAASSTSPDQDMLIKPLHDILWRLRIPCPPLENRREDIPAIVLRIWAEDGDRLPPILDVDGWLVLERHRRVGTYRDLESMARQLQHLFGGHAVSTSKLTHLLDGRSEKWLDCSNFDLKQHLAQEERRFMVEALLRSGGVVAGAASLAGLKRTTFLAKMKRHGLARI